MNRSIEIDFLWVPAALGGHSAEPFRGMRLEIRWQRHVRQWLAGSKDVQCEELTFDPSSGRGKAKLSFSSREPVPDAWLRKGELVELLNGYRVLAVGRITEGR